MDFDVVRQQIGVGALMAVGARNFVSDAEARALMFQVGSKRGVLEKVIVTLEPSDLYAVRYVAYRRRDYEVIAEEEVRMVEASALGATVRQLGDMRMDSRALATSPDSCG